MSSLNYIIKRLLQMIPVILVVLLLVFFMIRLIPGNPAQVMLGPTAPIEVVHAMEIKMGLDRPLIVQLGLFLKQIFTLDLGDSFKYAQSVNSLLPSRIVITLSLTLVSALFMMLLSVPFGYLGAAKKDKWPDHIVRGFTLIGLSMPSFWLALLLMLVFCITLKWLPITSWGESWGDRLLGLILPSFVLAVAQSAVMIRNLRNNIVDVQRADYVEFARSKGLEPSRIRSRHVIRNALIPFTTLFSIRVITMMGGTIVIENVFALPGLGSFLVEGILARDYSIVQATILFYVFVVQFVNLFTDVLYSFLDPRIKLQ